MTITFYKNTSENNALYKSLTEITTVTGVLKEQSSMIDPIIIFENIDSYIGQINYVYIAEFNRYYFITNIESVHNNLWRVSMHVDVLYTYRDKIKSNSAIIERNEIEYDLKLNDGIFKTAQNPRIAQFTFPSGFTNWDFVIGIAGN